MDDLAPVRVVAGDEDAVRAAVDGLVAAGRRLRDGSSLPADPWDLGDRGWVMTAQVADDEAQSAVVLAAARGVSVVVVVSDHRRRRALAADLGRIGPVEDLVAEADPARPPVALDPDSRRLLELLASGATLPEAAKEARLSIRTAQRRLTDARRALGVRTTAEAVDALAVLPADDGGLWG